ncbi:MAG: toprim domain-containing protein [Candidatus Shikimatogenerans sp. Ttur]|uniref:DNA gyrase subunit B n=1 Tax=Candidatus Shikimatogenerans sp. Ttur TaxID=3158569 RepID=A0AAU7ZXJ9_9FLAO
MLINYTSNKIKYINDIKHIRLRPSMYIGNTSIEGLHQLIYEVINNSVDEHTAGFCNIIKIKLYKNNIIKIIDNGRGIPIEINKKHKKPALELILTKLGTGGKFNNKLYKMSGGLHGVGLSCVNALSKKFIIKIFKNKYIYKQIYKKGKPISKIKKIKKTKLNGTNITFIPDNKIFHNLKFNKKYIKKYIKELSYINNKLKFFFYYNKKKTIYYSKKGIKLFFKKINNKKKIINNKYIYIYNKNKKINIEIIFSYNNSLKEKIISYVNNIKTIQGGTHIIGFKKGINKTLNMNFKKNNNIKITNKYFKIGLIAILNIKINNPKFEGQTKNKLTNLKIINLIKNITYLSFNIFLKKNNIFLKKLYKKILLYYKYKQEIIKKKELIYKKKKFLSNILPNKLSDCLFNKKYKSELYLVEGDSAGGTAKQGRNREFQAILPLKGKIINSEKSIQNKVLENNEIKNIFLSLGIFYKKKKIIISKIRYKKIIIMTDADIDGQHIITLILTFFIKYLNILIKKGYLYIVYPPLYLIKYKNKKIYI